MFCPFSVASLFVEWPSHATTESLSDLVYTHLAGPPLLVQRVNNFVSRGADPAVGGPADNSGAFALLIVDFLFVISHEKREECRRDWAGQSRNRDSVASTFPAKD
jgi:hypothetical protein